MDLFAPTIFPVATGSIPKHNMYVFQFKFELLWEKDEIKQKETGIGPFFKKMDTKLQNDF